MITFTIPTVPVAQPRQRHRIMSMGNKSFAQNYTPTKHPVNAFKSAVQMAARAAYQGAPLDGPISLRIVFVLPRPKKFCRKKDPIGRLWCPSKPDADNLSKSAKDAMSKLLFHDDAQVAQEHLTKFYAAQDEQPCVEVEIDVLV